MDSDSEDKDVDEKEKTGSFVEVVDIELTFGASEIDGDKFLTNIPGSTET